MKEKILVASCFAVVSLLAFVKLGQHPISAWDEARRAINALEMLRTGDYVNLRFCGQLDTWNNKPPLAVWLEAISFRVLGAHAFSLRLPSAIAIVAAFLVLFKTITLYRSASFAALTCLLLASVKGLIGWHVGRTGDTDALLVFFHLASVFCFLQYIDFGKNWGAVCFGACVGLAFLTKGAAAFTLLPGLGLYVIFTWRQRQPRAPAPVLAGLAMLAVFLGAWGVVQSFFGIKSAASGTALDRQFSLDLVQRFTQTADGWKEAFDFTFLFTSLDKIFNLWHYVFFGVLAFGLYSWLKNRRGTWERLLAPHNRLLLFSFCVYWPLALFLSIAAKSNRWYLAPALPFVGIITFWGIDYLWRRKTWVIWPFSVLLGFTLCRQFLLFCEVPRPPAFADLPIIKSVKSIQVASPLPQDLLCYLYFYGKEMRFDTAISPIPEGEIIVVTKQKMEAQGTGNFNIIGQNEGYLVIKAAATK
jgi:4-amino-4-deoxy-L-arabinose transferase-like glycosyltransferase